MTFVFENSSQHFFLIAIQDNPSLFLLIIQNESEKERESQHLQNPCEQEPSFIYSQYIFHS